MSLGETTKVLILNYSLLFREQVAKRKIRMNDGCQDLRKETKGCVKAIEANRKEPDKGVFITTRHQQLLVFSHQAT